MATATDAAFEKANSALLSRLGQEVLYTSANHEPIGIVGIVSYGEDLDDAQWKAALQASAEIWVNESDVPYPAPQQDTVSFDGEVWTVARKLGRSGGMWHLLVSRDLRPTFRK